MTAKEFYRYDSEKCYNRGRVMSKDGGLICLPDLRLKLTTFKLHSETPKGYWLACFFGGKYKWVSKTSRKRYAHPTTEEALIAYKHRKLSFVRHATNNLRRAEGDLRLVTLQEEMNKKGIK